jgi:arsenate reductase
MPPIRVLFICVHNSGRSQIAETFLRSLGQDRFEVQSAGTAPTAVSPLVMNVMREDGFNLANNVANSVRDQLRDNPPYNYVISTCGPDTLSKLPPLPRDTVSLSWAFPDPELVTGSPEEQLAAARAIRDDIRTQVIRFLHDQTTPLES